MSPSRFPFPCVVLLLIRCAAAYPRCDDAAPVFPCGRVARLTDGSSLTTCLQLQDDTDRAAIGGCNPFDANKNTTSTWWAVNRTAGNLQLESYVHNGKCLGSSGCAGIGHPVAPAVSPLRLVDCATVGNATHTALQWVEASETDDNLRNGKVLSRSCDGMCVNLNTPTCITNPGSTWISCDLMGCSGSPIGELLFL